MEAMIQRVDEERNNSGRPTPNFRVNRKSILKCAYMITNAIGA